MRITIDEHILSRLTTSDIIDIVELTKRYSKKNRRIENVYRVRGLVIRVVYTEKGNIVMKTLEVSE